MSEKSGFFNALQSGGVYDRIYDASDFASYFSSFIGNGVFASPVDQLKVVAKSGRTVTVKKGKAFIDGYYYELTEDKDITLSVNNTSQTVIDLICCTLDLSSRTISIKKREQVSSSTPTNNGTIHELVLASIQVGVAATTLTNAKITDTRPDENKCGFVASTVQQLKTAELFSQYDKLFNQWFNVIKDQLTDDAAGSLQTQINNLPTIRSGTGVPSNSLGKNGDIYIRIIT